MLTNSTTTSDEPTAVIFMGLQASGKSSFFRERFPDGFVHVNLDSLKTRGREWALVEECLTARKSFVVDNTNPTRADRARYVAPAKAAGYRVVGYFFQSRLHDCIARNAPRSGDAHVPSHAIAATSNRLELPDANEGFDEMWFVSIDPATHTFKTTPYKWENPK